MNMFDCFAAIGEAWAQAAYDAHIALFRTLAAITPTATKYNQVKQDKVYSFDMQPGYYNMADYMKEKIDEVEEKEGE